MTKKFCPVPWIFQAIRNNGDIRVCCQANPSTSKGLYRKNDGTVYNARRDDLNEARNSNLAKSIRKSMIEGEHHEACIRCDKEEANGVRSRRVYENYNWRNYFTYEDALRVTGNDGSIDTDEVPVVYYDLRFGNLCNLKCRMCGPTDSDAWYKDWVAMWGRTHFKDSHGNVELVQNERNKWVAKHDDYNWFESDYFWEQLEANIHNIYHIHTVGGEPLMIDKHYDLLKKCVDSGVAHNITVEYNTNLTNVPKRAWDLWPHFRLINLGVSLDGINEFNDYIRFPSKFKKLHNNLLKLEEAEGNYGVWIAATIQIYNVDHVPEFMKWILEQNFQNIQTEKDKPFMTAHPLHNPKFLNIKALPKEAKDYVAETYKAFYPWLDKWIDQNKIEEKRASILRNGAQKLLEGYKDFMYSEDLSHQLQEFWIYSNRLDEVRGHDWKEINPTMYELLKPYDKKV